MSLLGTGVPWKFIPVHVRFWTRVDIVSEAPCWVWKGSVSDKGYGHFSDGARRISAHRWSYESFTETRLSSDVVICHRCDNPRCVNPQHLFAGTHKDNAIDRDSKGRNGAVGGAMHCMTHLTNDDVETIVRAKREGASATVLAKQFGVSSSTIYRIAQDGGWGSEMRRVKKVQP